MKTQNSNTEAAAATTGLTTNRLTVILIIVAVVFFAAFSFAKARSVQAVAAGSAASTGVAGSATQAGGSAALAPAGGGCCGGGGAPVEGSAVLEGDVQKVAVDTSTGTFSPNVVKVKAGVPVEIAFSQAPGGCLSGVSFPDFDINEDLTAGAKTVTLPALEKGTYQFTCQMGMVSAQIVAE